MMRYLITLFVLLALPPALSAKVKIVASTSDLAYFAEKVGGEFVEVSYIAPPASDIHFVEVRPSYMLRLSKADIVLKVGMELDLWMDRIIDGSRNNNLTIVDCSRFIEPLEVPSFKADARYGDIHRYGNPHYWLTPDNAKPICIAIVEALSRVDAEHSELYVASQEKLLTEINSVVTALKPKLEELKGAQIIFYHNSWPYFNQFTKTSAVEFVEPYPGVAPSPTQIKKLIDITKSGDTKIIAMEPYFDKRVPKKIAQETGIKVVVLYPSIGGRKKNETYKEWMESNIDALLGALK